MEDPFTEYPQSQVNVATVFTRCSPFTGDLLYLTFPFVRLNAVQNAVMYL